MEENKMPLLHISGTLTVDQYKAAARIGGFRAFIRTTVLYLLVISLLVIGSDVIRNFSALKNGIFSFGELLSWQWKGMITDRVLLAAVFVLLIVYFALFCLIRPNRLTKRMRELSPQGSHLSYDFYEEELIISAENASGAETLHLRYADMKPRRRETRAYISVRTRQKNGVSLFKAIMTPEQIENARAILDARCKK